jgi:transposase
MRPAQLEVRLVASIIELSHDMYAGFAESVVSRIQVILTCLQAVKATQHISSANVHLRKAIQRNAAARKYVLVLLLLASFALLFFDWFYAGKARRK